MCISTKRPWARLSAKINSNWHFASTHCASFANQFKSSFNIANVLSSPLWQMSLVFAPVPRIVTSRPRQTRIHCAKQIIRFNRKVEYFVNVVTLDVFGAHLFHTIGSCQHIPCFGKADWSNAIYFCKPLNHRALMKTREGQNRLDFQAFQ